MGSYLRLVSLNSRLESNKEEVTPREARDLEDVFVVEFAEARADTSSSLSSSSLLLSSLELSDTKSL